MSDEKQTEQQPTERAADVGPSELKAQLEQPTQNPEDLPDDWFEDDNEPECHTCGGEGYIEANEAYCDWVNYGDELVDCPNCKGTGLRKNCSTF